MRPPLKNDQIAASPHKFALPPPAPVPTSDSVPKILPDCAPRKSPDSAPMAAPYQGDTASSFADFLLKKVSLGSKEQQQLDINSISSSTTRPSSRSSLYSTTLEEASNIASKRDSFREPRVKDDIRLHDSFPEQSTKATSEEFAFSSSSPACQHQQARRPRARSRRL